MVYDDILLDTDFDIVLWSALTKFPDDTQQRFTFTVRKKLVSAPQKNKDKEEDKEEETGNNIKVLYL